MSGRDGVTLSKRECEAVMGYVWNHSRASPEGLAYRIWQKMWAFVNNEPDAREAEALPPFEDEND